MSVFSQHSTKEVDTKLPPVIAAPSIDWEGLKATQSFLSTGSHTYSGLSRPDTMRIELLDGGGRPRPGRVGLVSLIKAEPAPGIVRSLASSTSSSTSSGSQVARKPSLSRIPRLASLQRLREHAASTSLNSSTSSSEGSFIRRRESLPELLPHKPTLQSRSDAAPLLSRKYSVSSFHQQLPTIHSSSPAASPYQRPSASTKTMFGSKRLALATLYVAPHADGSSSPSPSSPAVSESASSPDSSFVEFESPTLGLPKRGSLAQISREGGGGPSGPVVKGLASGAVHALPRIKSSSSLSSSTRAVSRRTSMLSFAPITG